MRRTDERRTWLQRRQPQPNGASLKRSSAHNAHSAALQQVVGTGADRRAGMHRRRSAVCLAGIWDRATGTMRFASISRSSGVWGLLTPAIVWLDRRLPFSGRALGRRLAAHILASIVFTEIYFYLFTTMRALMGVAPWSSLRISQLFSPAVIGLADLVLADLLGHSRAAYRPTSTTSAT